MALTIFIFYIISTLSAKKRPNKTLSQKQPKPEPFDRSEECVVCLDKPPTHRFNPCGHIVVCFDCAPLLQPKLCPYCRAAFINLEKVSSQRSISVHVPSPDFEPQLQDQKCFKKLHTVLLTLVSLVGMSVLIRALNGYNPALQPKYTLQSPVGRSYPWSEEVLKLMNDRNVDVARLANTPHKQRKTFEESTPQTYLKIYKQTDDS